MPSRGYIARELKKDLHLLYDSWRNTSDILGSARILSKMVAVAKLLDVNGIKDEEVEDILQRATAFSRGSANPRGIPILLVRIDTMVTRLKHELLKRGVWDVPRGESEPSEYDEEEEKEIQKVIKERIARGEI
jgi:hypothetical protein